MKKILVVVDVQHDFVDGILGSEEARAAIPNIVKKVNEYAKMEDALIVYTRDTHGDNYYDTQEGKHLPVPHCIKNTIGWDIVPEVISEEAAILIVDKPTFGDVSLGSKIVEAVWEAKHFDDEAIINYAPKSIEVVGFCTDICVVSNCMILKNYFPESLIVVDSSCCAGVTPAKHEAALEVMRSCQIDVI